VRVRWALLAFLGVGPLDAQATLADAARGAQAAWLAHDSQSLVGQGATLVVQIPGANPSAALERAQAAELLWRYQRTAVERDVRIHRVTELAAGNGLVELEREYAVGGTADVRRETIFLRYRQVGTRWELTELRAGP
jgi:hypothetical protein